MIAAGVVAGSTLRARDEAVRKALLTRSAHAIERELRVKNITNGTTITSRNSVGLRSGRPVHSAVAAADRWDPAMAPDPVRATETATAPVPT